MSGIPRTRLRIKQSKPLPRRPSPAAQPRSATGSASLPNGSWTRPDSARTGPPGKDRRNDQAASGE